MFALLLPLADALPDPKSPESVGWLVLTVAAGAMALNQIVSLWFKVNPRKIPPDHEVWATKKELAKLEEDHEIEMKRIERRFEEWFDQEAAQHAEAMAELRAWRGGMEAWQRTIERALGHVETKAETALQTANRQPR